MLSPPDVLRSLNFFVDRQFLSSGLASLACSVNRPLYLLARLARLFPAVERILQRPDAAAAGFWLSLLALH